ncbi:MAG: hypothetical protein QG622_97 [Actinomycetota bacterium]|nr:hypothetical protein [Actinomycetota bacterium]
MIRLLGITNSDRLGKSTGQNRINLHGNDPPGDGEETERERTQARADLQDDVAGVHTCRANNPPDGVGVDDEVLAEGLGGADGKPLNEFPHVRGPEKRRSEGHGDNLSNIGSIL